MLRLTVATWIFLLLWPAAALAQGGPRATHRSRLVCSETHKRAPHRTRRHRRGRPAKAHGLRHPEAVVLLKSQPGFRTRTDKRSYGTATAVKVFTEAVAAVRHAHPKAVDLPVGDLSYRGGGRMRPHRSHRDGRDMDVGYYFRDGRQRTHLAKVRAKTLDAKLTWALFDAMLKTGEVEFLFVSYRLQRALYAQARKSGRSKAELNRIFQWPRHWRNRRGIIRHERGHDTHFHVRFKR